MILINYRCLKHYLTPAYIENSNIMEMCGRICSILTLFIPVSNYNFEKLLNSLNLIYEEMNHNLGKLYIYILYIMCTISIYTIKILLKRYNYNLNIVF